MADLTAMQADEEVISQIAPLGWEPTFMALALGTKDDMEDGTNVDTKDGTTSEWFDLPCTACTLNPGPEANKLSAELASKGSEAGMPTKHGGMTVIGITAEELGKGTTIGVAHKDACSAARAACTVCEISATNSGKTPPVAGPAN